MDRTVKQATIIRHIIWFYAFHENFLCFLVRYRIRNNLYNCGGDQYLLFCLSQISILPKGWTIYIYILREVPTLNNDDFLNNLKYLVRVMEWQSFFWEIVIEFLKMVYMFHLLKVAYIKWCISLLHMCFSYALWWSIQEKNICAFVVKLIYT